MENLVALDSAGYREAVDEKNETCLVVFSKESCAVCKKLEPNISKVALSYENDDTVKFYAMDVKDEETKKIFKSMQLVGVPQTVFIKEGKVHETLPGALSEDILRKEINDMLNPKQGFGAKLKGLFGK